LRWSLPPSPTSSNLGRPEPDGHRRPEGYLGEVVDAGDDVPLYFLFAPALEEPELRSTFSILMLAQHDKLVAALCPVVSKRRRARRPGALPQQLGHDHRHFSVTERTTVVGGILLATLKQFLGHAVDSRSGRHLGASVRARGQGYGRRY
jgi:hypothetical protein